MWTLVYNGQEKELKDWGIRDDFTRQQSNKQKAEVTLRTVEGFDAGGPQFATLAKAEIWRDRDGIGQGGTRWFQGYFDDPSQINDGGIQGIEYRLYDVLWRFDRHQFRQRRKQFAGYTDHDPTKAPLFENVICSEIYLGETPNEVWQTNGQQILEVLNWVNECFNPTKGGAVGGRDDSQDIVAAGVIEPSIFAPRTRVNTIYSLEAINSVIRLQQDVVLWVDPEPAIPTLNVRLLGKWNYGTVPPTFIDYSNLPEVTVNITADQEAAIRLQSCETRRLPGVILTYRTTREVDGTVTPFQWVDKYPPAVTDYTPEAHSHLIELQGYRLMHTTAEVETAALDDLLSGNNARMFTWWKKHDQTLRDVRIDPATVVFGDVSILDKFGNAVDLGVYPNELISQLPKWTGRQVVHATVRCKVGFHLFADGHYEGGTFVGHVVDTKPTAREISYSIKLTDAETRTYSEVSEFDSGETPPEGVAESVYRSANAQQFAGEITFLAGQIRNEIKLGMRLKAIGPTTTFTNLLVQSIRERPHFGEMTVTYGPSAPLDVQGWIELARATRNRIIYKMPSGRADGGLSGGDVNVDQGGDAPADNTAHSIGGNLEDAVTFSEEES